MWIHRDDTGRAMHILGVHRSIADPYSLMQFALYLADGRVGRKGDLAVYEILKKVGMLIALKNALVTDLVGLERVDACPLRPSR
jgi:uncharacterized protein (DUF362 family)